MQIADATRMITEASPTGLAHGCCGRTMKARSGKDPRGTTSWMIFLAFGTFLPIPYKISDRQCGGFALIDGHYLLRSFCSVSLLPIASHAFS